MSSRELTCVVADDHPAVLDSLCRLLAESGIEVVGRAQDGDEALRLIEERAPRIAVLDIARRAST